MDQATQVALSLKCPNCESYLPTNEAGPSITNPFLHTSPGASIQAKYSNEGGSEQVLDILPNITEEAYIEIHPEARPARALHIMCAEGDVEGIAQLLKDIGDDEGIDPGTLIRFQNSLADDKSGLHLAVENSQDDVIWLMLWLSSSLPLDAFSQRVQEVARSRGVDRIDTSEANDIRALKDSSGKTAEDRFREKHGDQSVFMKQRLLSPSKS